MTTEKQNKFSCEAHIDMAIDDFLVENEISPCLEKSDKGICDYCSGEAVYIVKFPDQTQISK